MDQTLACSNMITTKSYVQLAQCPRMDSSPQPSPTNRRDSGHCRMISAGTGRCGRGWVCHRVHDFRRDYEVRAGCLEIDSVCVLVCLYEGEKEMPVVAVVSCWTLRLWGMVGWLGRVLGYWR